MDIIAYIVLFLAVLVFLVCVFASALKNHEANIPRDNEYGCDFCGRLSHKRETCCNALMRRLAE